MTPEAAGSGAGAAAAGAAAGSGDGAADAGAGDARDPRAALAADGTAAAGAAADGTVADAGSPGGSATEDGGAPAPAAAAARPCTTLGLIRAGDRIFGIPIDCLAEVARVTRVLPMIGHGPGLLGAIDLRGTIVPLTDPLGLAGIAGAGETPAFAAILRHDGRFLGLAAQEIVGLARPQPGAVQAIANPTPDGRRALTRAALLHAGNYVGVICVPGLFSDYGLPTVPDTRAALGSRGRMSQRPLLSFSAGGADFMIAATDVRSTVPRRRIERNALAGGLCLGVIVEHGQRIPVVDAAGALGLGRDADRSEAEIIILRFPGDLALGLAVDAIRKISDVDLSRACPLDASQAFPFLAAVVLPEGGGQSFLIDAARLHGDGAILDLARTSDRALLAADEGAPAGARSGSHSGARSGIQSGTRSGTPGTLAGGHAAETADAGAGAGAAVRTERRRYLAFDLGQPYVGGLDRIVRILPAPPPTVPVRMYLPGLVGLFALEGRSIPLVCLATLLGEVPAADSGTGGVLLVDAGSARVAFSVAAIHGVVTSAWRNETATPGGEAEVLIRVAGPEGAPLRRFADLTALAERVAAQVPFATGLHAAAPAPRGAPESDPAGSRPGPAIHAPGAAAEAGTGTGPAVPEPLKDLAAAPP